MTTGRTMFARLVACVLFVAAAPASAQPTAIRDFAAFTADNVVRLRATWSNGSSEAGFGYVVGAAGGRTTVATARHVVAQLAGGPYEAAQRIEVITKDGRSRPGLQPGYLDDADLDIAFVDFVDVPAVAPIAPVLASEAPTTGEEVWLFGIETSVRLAPSAGRVVSAAGSRVHVSALGGAPGSSGAPVVSGKGVIGLYLGAGDTAHVIPMQSVRRAAATLGRSWSLAFSPLARPTIAVELVRADALDLVVTTVPPPGGKGLSIPGRYTLAPGHYGLAYDSIRAECTPMNFYVSGANPTQRIEVACTPRIDGRWESDEIDAIVTVVGEGSWQFTSVARNSLPSNALSGRLVAKLEPTQFHANLNDVMGRQRSGSATLTSDLNGLRLVIPAIGGGDRILNLRRH